MKKLGHFCLGILPLIITISLQYFVSILLMSWSALTRGYSLSRSGYFDISSIFNNIMSMWTSEEFNTLVMIIYSVVCIAVFGAWYKHMHGNAAPDSSKAGWLSAYSVAGIVILVPGLQFLSAYILTLTAGIFPDALTVYEELLESSGLDNSISAGMILYTVVLAPVSEELTFRGVSFGYFRKCLPFWAAAFFQALLFGLFHMNLIQGVYVFFIALFFAYVYERSRSIYCSILLHIMYNFWGTVIAPYISFGETLSSFVFWFIFSLAATVAGITLFDKGMQKKLKPDVVTEDDAQEL